MSDERGTHLLTEGKIITLPAVALVTASEGNKFQPNDFRL
jgi:hypothetical protein